jgi:sugar phosphate isomerase/epimerase
MIKSSVTITLVPQIKTGPWIYREALEISVSKAAVLGFDGVELFTPDAETVDKTLLKQLLSGFNMQLSAVGTGAGKVLKGLTLTDKDPLVRKQAVSFIRDMISFGAVFGAPAIIGSMQGMIGQGGSREEAVNWLSEGLNELGKFAGNVGVTLILEPLNRYETNLINRFEEAAAITGSLDTKNIRLLADLFHMNIEERSMPDTIRRFGASIGHVHFADSNRNPVGNGHIQVGEIAVALQEINYDGFLSAEAFPYPDPDAAAEKTIESFKKYFRVT